MTNNKTEKKYDLVDRAMRFAARVARFVNGLIKNQASIEYGKQVIRSSSSIGANLEEADGTLSKRDFINKIAISRREARESKYWLSLIDNVGLMNNPDDKNEIAYLIGEAKEIMLILSSIINKTKNKI